jgi:hypothetical protein
MIEKRRLVIEIKKNPISEIQVQPKTNEPAGY